MFSRLIEKIKVTAMVVIKDKYKLVPIIISLLYFIASFFWIFFSDRITSNLFEDRHMLLIANIYKGWIYTFVIAIILYFLLKKAFDNIKTAERKLIGSCEELSAAHEKLESANSELSVSKEELKKQFDELKEYSNYIKVSEDRLKRAQSQAHVGNWEIGIDSNTMWASEEAFRLYGIPYESPLIPLKLAQNIVHCEDRIKMDLAMKDLLAGKKNYDMEFRIIRINDKLERIMHSVAKLEYDVAGRPLKILGVLRDITEKKENELRVYNLAYNDVLTGLPNRLKLEEIIRGVIEESLVNTALVFIDLDNFKYINDTFGHSIGDDVLQVIGRRLKSETEDKDCLFRLGGDEFAVLLMDISDKGQVEEFVKRVLNCLKINFCIRTIKVQITASMGVAIYPEHGESYEELFKNADTAMYKAKNLGKNCCMVFDKEMNTALYEKVRKESNLRTAINNNEFMLYYQPIFCLKTSKICGLEALARWDSPVYGMVQPIDFIPLAEETGLIVFLGKFVLKSACEFMKKLHSNGLHNMVMAVNISVRQLAQDNFVKEVLEIIGSADVDKKLIELEITESILMENIESNLKKIEILKSHGINVVLDDFGSGYSSLTYLKTLPISTLKVEKTFIDDIERDSIKGDITKTIIMLAHTLGIKVVAEGVETKGQFDMLYQYNCDLIQGYLISKPLPENDIMNLLKSEI